MSVGRHINRKWDVTDRRWHDMRHIRSGEDAHMGFPKYMPAEPPVTLAELIAMLNEPADPTPAQQQLANDAMTLHRAGMVTWVQRELLAVA